MQDHPLASAIGSAFARQRVVVSEHQATQFARYLELIERWNQVVSLTSIKDRPTAILRHFVEPAAAVPYLAGAGPRVLDTGSGVGCPGVAIKILDPEREVTLVEANGRKATFLREVVDVLELEGVHIAAGRFDELIAAKEIVAPVHVLLARAWTSGWGALLGQAAEVMAPGGRGLLFTGEQTLRSLRRNLVVPRPGAPTMDEDWRGAVAAGWQVRRTLPLPHLDRGFLVSLELPGE